MKHVTQIEHLLDENKTLEAEDALESLLSLGPNNTAALKLKTKLCEYKGQFEEESNIWRRIYEIDNEDADAITYFQLKQLEDQEHHYFTDLLPDGSQRMLTYQRPLLKPMIYGFLGSLSFIIFTHYGESKAPFLLDARALIPLFLLTVIAPVIWVAYKFFTTMYFVSLAKDKMSVSTRLKSHTLNWQDIKEVMLVHGDGVYETDLSVVFIPKNKELNSIEIDLGRNTTSIRSRHIFLKEVAFHFTKPAIIHRSKLSSDLNTIKF